MRKIKSRRRRWVCHDIPVREENRIQNLKRKNKTRDHLEDKHKGKDVNTDVEELGWEIANWTELVRDSDKWQGLL